MNLYVYRVNENCNDACARVGGSSEWRCVGKYMKQINNCATLEQYFPCAGSCTQDFISFAPSFKLNSKYATQTDKAEGKCMLSSD
jgi:hypothetical protein